MEGAVDERVDQAVGHAEEEDGVLQIVAQLQAMRKFKLISPFRPLCGACLCLSGHIVGALRLTYVLVATGYPRLQGVFLGPELNKSFLHFGHSSSLTTTAPMACTFLPKCKIFYLLLCD